MKQVVASLQNVAKDYQIGDVTYRALHGINLDIYKSDFATIIGPSGAGKSTVLHLLGGLDMPTKGKVVLNKHDTAGMPDNKLSRLRLNSVGFIFQSFNLIEVLTVYENIEYPTKIKKNVSVFDAEKRINWLIEKVGLTQYKNNPATALSGGQRQRVAIARALVNSPTLVLADEPTAALDSKTSKEILDLMQKMSEEDEVTFLFATHDPEVMSYAKRIIKIKDGKIIDDNN